MKKKALKKNFSNRKPISYSTEFRLDINLNNFVRKLCPAEGRGGELKCYIHTDRHTDRQTDRQTDRKTEPQTKRVLEEHSLLKTGLILEILYKNY